MIEPLFLGFFNLSGVKNDKKKICLLPYVLLEKKNWNVFLEEERCNQERNLEMEGKWNESQETNFMMFGLQC